MDDKVPATSRYMMLAYFSKEPRDPSHPFACCLRLDVARLSPTPFRGVLVWEFANKRTVGDRYPSSYTVRHTVICETVRKRSTLSREHFLHTRRVVCISFWTTSHLLLLLLLLALRVLQQTDSNASLISLSNGLSTDDVHNTPGDFSCVYYWVYSRGPFSAVGASGKVSCGSTTNEVGEAAD